MFFSRGDLNSHTCPLTVFKPLHLFILHLCAKRCTIQAAADQGEAFENKCFNTQLHLTQVQRAGKVQRVVGVAVFSGCIQVSMRANTSIYGRLAKVGMKNALLTVDWQLCRPAETDVYVKEYC